jgi:predicted dehydrogenase
MQAMAIKKLSMAVIGCGFFAQNHLNAWKEIPEVTLAAVCDAVPAKAQAAAQKFGARAYTHPAEMLAQEPLDFVDVVTNVMDHRSVVELVARHKKHVICQKPMAETVDDARAMVAACKAAGVTFMVHENFRWQTPLRAVKNVIDNGEIGTPFFGRASFRSSFSPYGNQPYLAEQQRFLIQDVGVHMIDVGRFFFGEPHSLMCHALRVNPNIKGEDVFTIMLAFDRATCIVDASFNTHEEHMTFPQVRLTIEGDQGVVKLHQDFRMEVIRNGSATTRTVRPPAHTWTEEPWTVVQDSVYNTNRNFVESLIAGKQPETNGDDNLKVMVLAYGAYEALEKGIVFRH